MSKFILISFSRSALLNLTQVDIWDQGRYDFYCPKTPANRISFCLTVLDKPRANLAVRGHHRDLFRVGHRYEVKLNLILINRNFKF